jgi:nicotinamidase-related amidase
MEQRAHINSMIVFKHWARSGFASTGLDSQLKQLGILKIILVAMIANTCIKATGRLGTELGYHVTLIEDATAVFSHEGMHAVLEVNGPASAQAILSMLPAEQR